ncbi:MAG: hypothetical protein B7Y36_00785 [Novosphingobium sp. 28-62-57]|uniref:energy transducer TonB n=1 Tax=unclassified Novosphingobium TaxID=2644732 RepID=UPI000BCA2BA1|nr:MULTISPECIES: energy transducer TonB [unclassified Novosphingobium]OYW49970.1 MAG: hypothetical protein B7Z34_06795 [Novosphingobium sp. 12-62-10]OYZ12124.1 MAG: hypothetical protein B7Y36_00785 [Novosphingobium sp. 28-62-57]OZA31603.1 MAG: hypothetical protein B7X92_14010 [Novosphingobium sp. 17-62-9]HQS69515.1 energy transducer TonB [Novosphingobium sp.]
MFIEREPQATADDYAAFAAFGDPAPAAILASSVGAETSGGGRYGEARRLNLPGIVLAVAVHLAIVPVLLSLGYHAVAKQEDRLVAINLSPPPPPPAAAPDQPQPKRLETQITPPQVTPPVPLIVPVTQPLALPIPDASPPKAPVALAAPPVPSANPAAVAAPSMVTSESLGTRMVSGRPPRYPVESRRRKEQGTVKLQLVLGLDGVVETIAIARSSGFDRLDAAALGAVRTWRWQPTLQGGVPVKVKGVVEIPFVLKAG